jgi:hypothetical protein
MFAPALIASEAQLCLRSWIRTPSIPSTALTALVNV